MSMKMATRRARKIRSELAHKAAQDDDWLDDDDLDDVSPRHKSVLTTAPLTSHVSDESNQY